MTEFTTTKKVLRKCSDSLKSKAKELKTTNKRRLNEQISQLMKVREQAKESAVKIQQLH